MLALQLKMQYIHWELKNVSQLIKMWLEYEKYPRKQEKFTNKSISEQA